RWYGVTAVQSTVTVGTSSTVTFATTPVTLRLVSSNGTGLSGQDAAFFFKQSGTGVWNLAGAPDASGTAVQEVLPAGYDLEARWFDVLTGQTVTVSAGAPPTAVFQTTRATLRLLS